MTATDTILRNLILVFWFIPLASWAQMNLNFGSSANETPHALTEISEGYIISGSRIDQGSEQAFLARVSHQGSLVWMKKISGVLPLKGLPFQVLHHNGALYLSGSDNYDAGMVAKFNLDGNLVWARRLSCSSTASVMARSLTGLPNGNIAISFTTGCGQGSSDAAISILNENGVLQQSKHFSEAGNDHYPGLISGLGNELIGLGNINAFNGGVRSGYISRMDENLNLIEHTVVMGDDGITLFGGDVNSNADRLFIGVTTGFGSIDQNILLLNFDAVMNLNWARTYNFEGNEIASSVIWDETDSAGYFVFSTDVNNSDGETFLVKFEWTGAIIFVRNLSGKEGSMIFPQSSKALSLNNGLVSMIIPNLIEGTADNNPQVLVFQDTLMECDSVWGESILVQPSISNPIPVEASLIQADPFSLQVEDINVSSEASGCYCEEPSIGFFLEDDFLCEGDTLKVSVNPSDLISVYWSTGDTGLETQHMSSGTYWVEVETQCGSKRIEYSIQEEICSCTLSMPNVFSPNGDGLNDFLIPDLACESGVFRLEIYNRWGQLITSSAEPQFSWDGNFNGRESSEGVYYFIAHFGLDPNQVESISGYFHLIR